MGEVVPVQANCPFEVIKRELYNHDWGKYHLLNKFSVIIHGVGWGCGVKVFLEVYGLIPDLKELHFMSHKA